MFVGFFGRCSRSGSFHLFRADGVALSIACAFASLWLSGCWESNDLKSSGPVESSSRQAGAAEGSVLADDRLGQTSDRPTNEGAASEMAADPAIKILAWNIESDGADAGVIAEQLRQMPRYDIYGFTEVRPDDFPKIKAALGPDYFFKYSKSGFDDRLAFAIRKTRFEFGEDDYYEFNAFGDWVLNPGNFRAPFVFEVTDKISGKAFALVLNHLARGNEEIRMTQAIGLRQWAQQEAQAVIAIGDYNFDYVFATDKGNPAMDAFLEGDVFEWIRPQPMVDSNYYDGDGDGVDDFIDSLLDFVFVAGPAKAWKLECEVVVRENDFPDDERTSDHRPIQLIIQ